MSTNKKRYEEDECRWITIERKIYEKKKNRLTKQKHVYK